MPTDATGLKMNCTVRRPRSEDFGRWIAGAEENTQL